MRRTLVCVIAACVVMLLAACGEKNSPAQSMTASNTSITFSVDDDSSTESTVTDSETDSDESNEKEDGSASGSESSKKSSSANTSSKKTSSKTTSTASKAIPSQQESDISSEPEDSEYVVSAEEVESQLSGYESEIVGEWKVKYILDSNDEEVKGTELYGTAYSQYGGSLSLRDDGTFSVVLGVSASDESTTGTYSYGGGSDINLLYYNDTSVDCERVTINDEEAIAMPVEILGDTFKVYFIRA